MKTVYAAQGFIFAERHAPMIILNTKDIIEIQVPKNVEAIEVKFEYINYLADGTGIQIHYWVEGEQGAAIDFSMITDYEPTVDKDKETDDRTHNWTVEDLPYSMLEYIDEILHEYHEKAGTYDPDPDSGLEDLFYERNK